MTKRVWFSLAKFGYYSNNSNIGSDRDIVEERLRVATDTASGERARAETRLRDMDELQQRAELERNELLSLIESLKVTIDHYVQLSLINNCLITVLSDPDHALTCSHLFPVLYSLILSSCDRRGWALWRRSSRRRCGRRTTPSASCTARTRAPRSFA